jgi:putative flippase GtrA
MKATSLRLASFVAVGCTAGAVHFGMVVLLVETLALAPLVANVIGWLVAFVVSFLGQSLLTFGSRRTPWTQALPRFFAISLAGFLANESAYALLLHATPLPYDLLLALVLIGVAVMTYLFSSRWVFRGSPSA